MNCSTFQTLGAPECCDRCHDDDDMVILGEVVVCCTVWKWLHTRPHMRHLQIHECDYRDSSIMQIYTIASKRFAPAWPDLRNQGVLYDALPFTA